MSQDLNIALKALLIEGKTNTQEEICLALEKQGFEVNQTKVSRLLRTVGAVKVLNAQGQVIYSLPREPSPPTLTTPLRNLILEIVANEVLVIIYTSPGSASMVARLLDYQLQQMGILGTIAGDDTIFIAPKTIKETSKVAANVRKFLLG